MLNTQISAFTHGLTVHMVQPGPGEWAGSATEENTGGGNPMIGAEAVAVGGSVGDGKS